MSDGPGLALTGERTLPGIWHERYWFARHEVSYRYVADALGAAAARGGRARVLDAGSGEGYGADHLSTATGARVVGIDYDPTSVAHARRTYPSVDTVRANLVALPLRDACVDAVVSLQTVEHVWDQPGFVAECARVLRPGGLLAVSTPNRRTFPAGNPFHVRELDAAELSRLLAPRAGDLRLLGVHHGARIQEFETRRPDLVRAQLDRPYGAWDTDLAAFVAGLSAVDFVIAADSPEHPLERSLDLLALGSAR